MPVSLFRCGLAKLSLYIYPTEAAYRYLQRSESSMMTCDFCLVKREMLWGFSVAHFYEPVWDVTNIEGEWAICEECKIPFEAHNLDGILARGARPHAPMDMWRRFYTLLRLNVTGPLVPCTNSTDVLYPEKT